jgi:hypothetical protein
VADDQRADPSVPGKDTSSPIGGAIHSHFADVQDAMLTGLVDALAT